ncbi:hypothetical protein SAMN06265355_106351 [Actinomadura mexicana]|uniref:Uncharacterized protein n=1 Tax=Actinomadura mexicana TaxID=134959 RepID=A0A238Z0C4_9ACTN|nr:hypothetical protein SAMN06265355_106351 [Actinomadura mexicana]
MTWLQASSVLRVLKNRGVEVSEEERKRILECTDIARLETWLDRSLTVRVAAEISGRGEER